MTKSMSVPAKKGAFAQNVLFASVAGALLSLTSLPALAVLEEVIVTAQKREENMQTVAVAVSAFSADTLRNTGMLNVDDLTRLTPGFTITNYNPVTPQPYIRGIGSNPSDAGSDSSVGVFVDEVYAGRAGGYSADMLDIERVEVLRGPQGTLYGRNVPGGAINIISKRPTEELEGFLEVTGGEYDLWGAKAAISGPLSDTVLGRLAISTRQRDGHTENIITGNDLRDEDNSTFRGRLDFLPSDTVSVQLIAEYSEDDLLGPGARNHEGQNANLFLISLGLGFLTPLDPPTSSDPYKVELVNDGFAKREMGGLSLKVDWEFDSFTLTSVTGYRENDYEFSDDILGISVPLVINRAEESSEQFSQEIRLSGSTDKVQWTTGLYYLREDVDRLEFNDLSALDPVFGLDLAGLTAAVGYDQKNETTSYAAFAQFTYSLTDALNITLGGRLSQDEKDFSLTTTGFEIGFGQLTPDPETGITGPFSASDDESWSDFTPKVSLEYTSSDELFLYATYAKGFKSGGYNGLATDSGAATTPFDQEEVDSYEVGLKADFFENLMRLNVAAYYMDYVDLQVFLPAPGGIGFVVENAGEATIQGLELELFVSPLDGLDFSATYSYIDSDIDEFEGRPELVGNNLSRTPENAASLSAQYIAPLGDQLSLLMRADYSYQDKIFLDIGNSSISAADSYELVNVRLALQSEGVWEVALWGRNITDEEYRVHGLDSTFGENLSAATIIGDPSMWGVTASYFF